MRQRYLTPNSDYSLVIAPMKMAAFCVSASAGRWARKAAGETCAPGCVRRDSSPCPGEAANCFPRLISSLGLHRCCIVLRKYLLISPFDLPQLQWGNNRLVLCLGTICGGGSW